VVSDWLDLVEVHDVDGVIAATGGHGSARLLDLLPWSRLRAAARPVIGYSDVTSLLWAAYRHGVPAIHGPMILSEFGHADGPMPMAVDSLSAALAGHAQRWQSVVQISVDDPQWDIDDARPLARVAVTPWRALRHGQAVAPVLAGCLPTVSSILTASCMPAIEGHFLLLEDPDLEPQQFATSLLEWKRAGVLDRVRGMGFGRRKGRFAGSVYDGIVLDILGAFDIPLLADLDFGHTEPMYAIPLGSQIEVDTRSRWLALRAAHRRSRSEESNGG